MRTDCARPSRRALVAAALLAATALAGAAGVARRRFAAEIRSHVDGLYADVDTAADVGTTANAGTTADADTAIDAGLATGAEPSGRFDPADVADLPAPVRRYFERVLESGQPHVSTAQIRQRGAFRLGGADADWLPLRATQDVATRPPGFVWDATIDVAPGVPVRVVDCYRDGNGLLEARLFGAVPVASAGGTPEMDEGELLRYLAEAVWVPTALLPAYGVRWEAVDDASARAILEDDGVTAEAVFHFGDDDTVERVTARRYRQEDGRHAQWTGYFREYETRDGMAVPTAAEVAWNLPEGGYPYWRATIEAVTYLTGESSA